MPVIKVLVFLFLTGVFLKACFDAFNNYLRPPTAFKISHIDAESFEAPAISILRMPVASGPDVTVESFESLMEARAKIDFSVTGEGEILHDNSLSDSLETRTISIIANNPIDAEMILSGTTFVPKNKTNIGMRSMVSFQISLPAAERFVPEHSVFHVLVHNKDVRVPSINKVFGSDNVNIKPMLIFDEDFYPLLTSTFELEKSVIKIISTEENPCYDPDVARKDTLTGCIESFIVAERLGCKPPWFSNDSYTNLRTCGGDEDFRAFLDISTDLENTKESDVLRMTGCKRPCVREDYELKLKFRGTEHVSRKTINDMVTGRDGFVRIAFYFSKGTFQVKEEIVMYGLGDLVADVGGYLGLLLGASIFAIYEKIEKYFSSRF